MHSVYKSLPLGFMVIVAASAFPTIPTGTLSPRASISASAQVSWSPSQLVDVTGEHGYRDPLPGQARGPCPAQNALANHGYLDRSGYTSFLQCVSANKEVFNMGEDLGSYLCLMGQLAGGDTLGTSWSIGNSSAFDNTIKSSCGSTGLLGTITNLGCAISKVLDWVLGTPGFGMAQTHNAFEADSSFLRPDWTTINGLDASTNDMSAVKKFWKKKRADGTFDDLDIFIDWASYRKEYGIQTNPCYFRAPQATLFASLGAYSFAWRLFSNYTAEKPAGTLTAETLASFQGLDISKDGTVVAKEFGKERIPPYWYKRNLPYTVPEWLTNDYSKFYLRDPTLASIGGNTNGVNTFAGIDIGDLTGGIINGRNLLQGDNFACFYYRILQQQILNRLGSTVGGELLQLGTTLGQVIDVVFGKMIRSSNGPAGCPKFAYADLSSKGNWCAVRQQPKGIY